MVAARGSAVLQNSNGRLEDDCREDGAYAIQLKTKGRSHGVEERITGQRKSWTLSTDDEAFLHVELTDSAPSPEPGPKGDDAAPRLAFEGTPPPGGSLVDRIADTSDRQGVRPCPKWARGNFHDFRGLDRAGSSHAATDPKQIAGGTSGFS